MAASGGDGTRAEPRARGVGGAGWRRAAAVWVLAFVVFVVQSPGRMTFDTKLGVNIDPVGFYQRLWHLWNPLEWMGGLQDQYIGYVFPMGAYYLVAHLLRVPIWIAERLWMSLLVAVAFWGLVRLAEALGIGSSRTRLAAGAAFALWPTFTILVGSTSAAILPGVLAPWAVLPLTRASTARTAATRSGLVVLCMGGVNAASTLAALLVPGLYILTAKQGVPGRRRISLAIWWAIAVLLATMWWLIPLLYQGRYGFNFLPYIEQASNTTHTMSAATLLRGSGDWVAYLSFGHPWLPAGWTLVTSPVAVGGSALAAALGLAGLACRDLPEGAWLRWTVGVASLVALSGYAGPFGAPFHGTVAGLLNGPLAPLRNIYKVEPAVAVALALGIAHLLAKVVRRVPALRLVTWAAVAGILVALGMPYLTGRILQPGAFASVPDYWRQAAGFLQAHAPTQTALVVPANSHGLYSWGQPIDEPLEPLARSPWVQRDLVPFSGGGVRDLLDGAERAIDSGTPVPGLAEYLGRAGVRYVVVRNDLDPSQPDYTPPALVHRTLSGSGFTRVAAFGPPVLGGHVVPGTALQVAEITPWYPAVEIFQSGGGNLPAGPAAVLPADRTVLVDGGPASLLQLADQERLRGRPAVIAGQAPAGLQTGSYEVTDGLRRADTVFGLPTRNTSYTYTATETNPAADPHGRPGAAPRQLLPDGTAGRQTVAVLTGAAEVTASSYGSWLWQVPQGDPVNAFDGDPSTAWVEGTTGNAVGQWVQVRFDRPLALSGPLQVRLLADQVRRMPTRLVVTTAAGQAATDVRPTADPQPLNVPAGTTDRLRITIAAAQGGIPGGPGAGIAEVTVPGVKVSRFLQPAQSQPQTASSFTFQRDTAMALGLPGAPPEPALNRTFTTPATADFRFAATASAIPGPALDSLLNRLADHGPKTLHIQADSTFGNLPSMSARNLLDGSDATGWLAADAHSGLHLRWSGTRRIDTIRLTFVKAGISAAPTKVRISAPGGVRELDVPPDGELRFSPLTTDRLDLDFPQVTKVSVADPLTGGSEQLPVGLAEVRIPALADLPTETPRNTSRVALPCGQGPAVTIDGHSYATSITGTVADLLGLRPLPVKLCGPLSLPAGKHWLTSPGSPGPLAIIELGLTLPDQAAPAAPTAPATQRTMHVRTWAAEQRTVDVGPGPASYLEVHQAVNPGWSATLNGQRLTPVTLDGWQQAYLLPAGQGGQVTLSFEPAHGYHWLLGIAAAAVVALIVLALVPASRSAYRVAPGTRRAPSGWRLWAGAGAVALLLLVIGGPLALAVPVVLLIGLWREALVRWLAFAAAVAAGVFAVTGLRHGAFGAPAQAAAVVGLSAALTPGRSKRAVAEPEPSVGTRRRWGVPALMGAGAFLVALGLIVHYYAEPRLLVAPTDIEQTAVLEAHNATYFDPGALRTRTGAVLTDIFTVRGDPGAGSEHTAVWDSFGTLGDQQHDVQLELTSERLAFDRRTGLLRHCCGTSAAADVQGIGLFWPIGVERRTYQVYDQATGRTWPMTYAGTGVTSGIKVYRFAQHVPDTKVAVVSQVPASVLGLRGVKGSVPADRYYRADAFVSVDPRTGVVIDQEQRVVSTLRGAAGKGELVAADMDLKMTADTRRQLAARAREAGLGVSAVRDLALPVGLGLGLLLVASGAALWLIRSRRSPAAG